MVDTNVLEYNSFVTNAAKMITSGAKITVSPHKSCSAVEKVNK